MSSRREQPGRIGWVKYLGSSLASLVITASAMGQSSLPEKIGPLPSLFETSAPFPEEPAPVPKVEPPTPFPEKWTAPPPRAASPIPLQGNGTPPLAPGLEIQGAIGDDAPRETRGYSLWETLWISMCGRQPDPDRNWTPLCCNTFFTDGCCEPWNAPPPTTGGSLRQTWVGMPDAFFNRQIIGSYSNLRGVNGNPNEQVGAAVYETPITRRYMFGVVVPFVDRIDDGNRSSSTFGDVVFFNRFLLEETRDFTLSFNLNVRAPTGDTGIGNGHTSIIPYLAFFKDVGYGISIRGAGGADVPVDDKTDGRTASVDLFLGIGQTITPHETPCLGDFTYYASCHFRQDFGNGVPAFVSFTPGIRTHLGYDFYLLAGVELPVTGPQTFQQRYTFMLLKGF